MILRKTDGVTVPFSLKSMKQCTVNNLALAICPKFLLIQLLLDKIIQLLLTAITTLLDRRRKLSVSSVKYSYKLNINMQKASKTIAEVTLQKSGTF